MAFTPIVVTGTYVNPDGSAAIGQVVFTPTAVMKQPGGKIVDVAPIVGFLNATTGAFSVVLMANDDTTTTPTGVGYNVVENVGPNARPYTVIIPHTAAGGTIDMSVLAPTTTVPNYAYIVAPNPLAAGYLQWSGTSWVIGASFLTGAAPGATPAINCDTTNIADFTGLAAAVTSLTTNLTGTPVAGQALTIKFTDNGTARTLAFGAKFTATTVALPTTTVISQLLTCYFQYDTVAAAFRLMWKA